MNKRKLPIGIQTFRKIREEDCYYVDKTAYIRRLLDEGTHYFLSRPRHFGKSLFLDTLKEVFEGNEPLFAGLYIHDHWDWSVRHPVVRLSFGFSGLNNLKDITLDPRYSAICGYTEADLDSVFAPELPGLDREQIRDWYNGYRWRGDEVQQR